MKIIVLIRDDGASRNRVVGGCGAMVGRMRAAQWWGVLRPTEYGSDGFV